MEQYTIIGICASVLTATSLIPQLIKLMKDKKTRDISNLMLIVLFSGLGLWIYYGILRSDWIIIISNSFALLINLITGILMIYYNRK
jgi:MtN3 and saliva related transmembrane protein